ncbi:hypothetical protein F5888DRAFT_1639199 [Russula emetica]|nr:hypothetical protein F5888DRAFT_1639199 [Russula emetica]
MVAQMGIKQLRHQVAQIQEQVAQIQEQVTQLHQQVTVAQNFQRVNERLAPSRVSHSQGDSGGFRAYRGSHGGAAAGDVSITPLRLQGRGAVDGWPITHTLCRSTHSSCAHRTLAELAPPAVPMGAPFRLLYPARSFIFCFVLTYFFFWYLKHCHLPAFPSHSSACACPQAAPPGPIALPDAGPFHPFPRHSQLSRYSTAALLLVPRSLLSSKAQLADSAPANDIYSTTPDSTNSNGDTTFVACCTKSSTRPTSSSSCFMRVTQLGAVADRYCRDLACRARTPQAAWLKHFRHTTQTFPFRSARPHQRTNLASGMAPAFLCPLKVYEPSATVGVVSFPNIGKSSLINTLKTGQGMCRCGAAGTYCTKELQVAPPTSSLWRVMSSSTEPPKNSVLLRAARAARRAYNPRLVHLFGEADAEAMDAEPDSELAADAMDTVMDVEYDVEGAAATADGGMIVDDDGACQ